MKKSDMTEAERMAIADRIREAVALCRSKVYVANECGVTEQAVTGWETTGRIAKKHFQKISDLSGLNLLWLLTGEGEKRAPPVLTEDQSEVVSLMRSMDERERAAFVLVARKFASPRNGNSHPLGNAPPSASLARQ